MSQVYLDFETVQVDDKDNPEILGYRTNIFPNELEPITVYQERE